MIHEENLPVNVNLLSVLNAEVEIPPPLPPNPPPPIPPTPPIQPAIIPQVESEVDNSHYESYKVVIILFSILFY